MCSFQLLRFVNSSASPHHHHSAGALGWPSIPAHRRFRHTPRAASPSSLLSTMESLLLRCRWPGSMIPSRFSLTRVSGHRRIPIAFIPLSHPTLPSFGARTSGGARCLSRHRVWLPFLQLQLLRMLNFLFSDMCSDGLGLLGFWPGRNTCILCWQWQHLRVSFSSWRRCHGHYLCPSSSIRGNPRYGFSDRTTMMS